jgi:hypothetical protein
MEPEKTEAERITDQVGFSSAGKLRITAPGKKRRNAGKGAVCESRDALYSASDSAVVPPPG